MPNAPKQFRPKTAKQRKLNSYDLRRGFRGRNRQEAKKRIGIRDEWRCQWCGCDVHLGNSILDHVVPLSHGGGHRDANLQTLCRECDRKKRGMERGGL